MTTKGNRALDGTGLSEIGRAVADAGTIARLPVPKEVRDRIIRNNMEEIGQAISSGWSSMDLRRIFRMVKVLGSDQGATRDDLIMEAYRATREEIRSLSYEESTALDDLVYGELGALRRFGLLHDNKGGRLTLTDIGLQFMGWAMSVNDSYFEKVSELKKNEFSMPTEIPDITQESKIRRVSGYVLGGAEIFYEPVRDIWFNIDLLRITDALRIPRADAEDIAKYLEKKDFKGYNRPMISEFTPGNGLLPVKISFEISPVHYNWQLSGDHENFRQGVARKMGISKTSIIGPAWRLSGRRAVEPTEVRLKIAFDRGIDFDQRRGNVSSMMIDALRSVER